MSSEASRPALTSFYEVYDKRSLFEPLSSLPLLDRDRDIKVAMNSARIWGGCVFRVQAHVLEVRPRLRRTVVAAELIFQAPEHFGPPEAGDHITVNKLRGFFRKDGRVKYRRPRQ